MNRIVDRPISACLQACLFLVLAACAASPGKRASADPFKAIDAHALAAPPAVESSVADLSAYLTETAKTDREKARAIFRWVAENISYDVEGYGTSHFGDLSPDGVLRSREAVCEGYANLFDSLARAAGLEAVTVSGYAKGMGYRAGDHFTGAPNHAWNAVRIDGGWQLLDCTWAAGLFYEGVGYKKRFGPYFFCTPPEEFLYTHFPVDPRWQLVGKPISLDRFVRMPYLKAPFFTHRLEEIDHRSCVIETASSPVRLRFTAPQGVDLRGTLYAGGKAMGTESVRVESRGGMRAVRVTLPEGGTYFLKLFVSDGEQAVGRVKLFDLAAEYKIEFTGKPGGK